MHKTLHKVTAQVLINLDIATSWQKLSDLRQPHCYVPDLTHTEITTDMQQGVGTSRRVYSRNRPALIESVVQWNTGKGFRLRLHHDNGDGVPPLFSRATFEYAISATSDTQTCLSNTLEFEMRWGLVGALLVKLIMRPMQQMQNQIAIGQKLFYETGQKADPEQVKALIRRTC